MSGVGQHQPGCEAFVAGTGLTEDTEKQIHVSGKFLCCLPLPVLVIDDGDMAVDLEGISEVLGELEEVLLVAINIELILSLADKLGSRPHL